MKIMISYRATDRAIATEVYDFLAEAKYKVWIDRDMRPGAEWRSEFIKQVKLSDVCIPIITTNYIQSEHCRLELFVARSYGQRIFPVMVEKCWDKLEDFEETRGLSRIQGIKLYNMQAVGLKISKKEMLTRVVNALEGRNKLKRHGVYVSFFSENAELATRTADQLNRNGVPTWIATRDSTVGVDWRNEQAHAMLSSACHLVVVRPGVTKNEFLKTEAMLAEAIGIPVYTVLEPGFSDEESISQLNTELRNSELTFRRLFDRNAFRIASDAEPLNSDDVDVLRKEIRKRRKFLSWH